MSMISVQIILNCIQVIMNVRKALKYTFVSIKFCMLAKCLIKESNCSLGSLQRGSYFRAFSKFSKACL